MGLSVEGDDTQMEYDLSERLLGFAVDSLRFVASLKKDEVTSHVARQFMHAATSAGANYEEACAAETKADFVHKLQISLKETRESLYWLRLAQRARLCTGSQVESLLKECTELTKILGKSVVTAKTRRPS